MGSNGSSSSKETAASLGDNSASICHPSLRLSSTTDDAYTKGAEGKPSVAFHFLQLADPDILDTLSEATSLLRLNNDISFALTAQSEHNTFSQDTALMHDWQVLHSVKVACAARRLAIGLVQYQAAVGALEVEMKRSRANLLRQAAKFEDELRANDGSKVIRETRVAGAL